MQVSLGGDLGAVWVIEFVPGSVSGSVLYALSAAGPSWRGHITWWQAVPDPHCVTCLGIKIHIHLKSLVTAGSLKHNTVPLCPSGSHPG